MLFGTSTHTHTVRSSLSARAATAAYWLRSTAVLPTRLRRSFHYNKILFYFNKYKKIRLLQQTTKRTFKGCNSIIPHLNTNICVRVCVCPASLFWKVDKVCSLSDALILFLLVPGPRPSRTDNDMLLFPKCFCDVSSLIFESVNIVSFFFSLHSGCLWAFSKSTEQSTLYKILLW